MTTGARRARTQQDINMAFKRIQRPHSIELLLVQLVLAHVN